MFARVVGAILLTISGCHVVLCEGSVVIVEEKNLDPHMHTNHSNKVSNVIAVERYVHICG